MIGMPKYQQNWKLEPTLSPRSYLYNIPLRYLTGLVYGRRSSGKKDIGSN
jgi:hypothetical protein